ncbi:hypothetical protein [Mycobacterium canetti]|uniref:DUF7391 family protein n=1 Tax=Mycobacterium canetti TaxID=78331 RepID=UPI0012F673BD|nr:hypothetical protein [Mycobacterium canetti]
MTSPTDQQTTRPGACTLPPPGWVCTRDAGHPPPCAATQSAPEPPAADPLGPAPAAPPLSQAPANGYWLPRTTEADLDLPSGGHIRYRKIRDGSELEFELLELLDGFTPELMAAVQGDDETQAAREIAKPENRAKIFDPINRVVAAAVVCPKVVLDGPSTDEEVNVTDIDLLDRMVIFNAALGEQLNRLKSVLTQQEQALRNLSTGEDIQPAAQ